MEEFLNKQHELIENFDKISSSSEKSITNIWNEFIEYSHINILFKEFNNTFKKNNSLFELFLNEGGVWDDIVSYLEEDDKKLYKLNKLKFKYIYENYF